MIAKRGKKGERERERKLESDRERVVDGAGAGRAGNVVKRGGDETYTDK